MKNKAHHMLNEDGTSMYNADGTPMFDVYGESYQQDKGEAMMKQQRTKFGIS